MRLVMEGVVVSMWLAASSTSAQESLADQVARCREAGSGGPESAVVAGRVTERSTGLVLEHAQVRIEWMASEGGRTRAEATTGPDGVFRLCSVPRDTELTVSAAWLGRPSGVDTVWAPLAAPGLVHNLTIGLAPETTVEGQILGATRGEAVSGATVRWTPLGPGVDAESTVLTTDAGGRFAMGEAMVGQHLLEVTALGYGTVTDTVESVGGRANHITVRLPEHALDLEGVLVEVEARLLRLEEAGFYSRRQDGLGVFLDADEIRPRLPTPVVQLFDNTPGLQISSTVGQAGGREVLLIRNCLPTIYMDGILARKSQQFYRNPNPTAHLGLRAKETSPLYLSDMVSTQDIAGIEVYRSPAELPIQYGGTGAGDLGTQCGVVLVWTH